MNLPTEYILQCGYFPDRFAERGMRPDVFFIHVDLNAEVQHLGFDHMPALLLSTPDGSAFYWDVLADAAAACVQCVQEKYEQLHRLVPFNEQDLFWSVSPKEAS